MQLNVAFSQEIHKSEGLSKVLKENGMLLANHTTQLWTRKIWSPHVQERKNLYIPMHLINSCVVTLLLVFLLSCLLVVVCCLLFLPSRYNPGAPGSYQAGLSDCTWGLKRKKAGKSKLTLINHAAFTEVLRQ